MSDAPEEEVVKWAKRRLGIHWRRAFQHKQGNGSLLALADAFRAGWFAATSRGETPQEQK